MPRLGPAALAAVLALSPVIAASPAATQTAIEVGSDAEIDISRLVLNPTTTPGTSVAVNFSAPPALSYTIELENPDGAIRAVTTQRDGFYLVKHTWSAVIEGLEPSTEYRYRIVQDETTAGDWHSFTTAASDAEPFEFLYFGDAQEGLDDEWPPVIRAGFEYAPDAALSLHSGDLVNYANIQSEWDDWFAALGEDAAGRLVMPVPGNHETYVDLDMSHFRQNFTLPRNGVTEETSYYYDYQGVRFVGLDGNRDLQAQADWLDEVLADNPHPWSVVTAHQPVYSTAVGRNEPEVRAAFGPVIEEHNVDLVLQGHDHTYARGHHNDSVTDEEGVTDGPVYVVSNAGPKYYQQQPVDDNTWTQNDATQVVRHGQTSTFQRITVDGCRLEYTSVIGAKGASSTTDLGIGEVLDQFSIDQCDGGKRVYDGPVADDGLDEEVPEEPLPGEVSPTPDPTGTPTDEPPVVEETPTPEETSPGPEETPGSEEAPGSEETPGAEAPDPTDSGSPSETPGGESTDDPGDASADDEPTDDPGDGSAHGERPTTESPSQDEPAQAGGGDSNAGDSGDEAGGGDSDDEAGGGDSGTGDSVSLDPDDTDPPGAEGTLPRTGSSVGSALAIGLGLVAFGGVLLMLRRFRP
ncbi:hypothetical protein GCM10022261_08710 [Brevibacterium daeguense]|uniref:Calcineurin-like phosphoesterase domain-containing protein n=1 Tax=Brevibacterium daeguense TaxID=909936 RepID=A0ABP8EHB2_9MICO|nr:metallophosphoesterase family protein [Brevibacterium daeguense]